MMRPVRLTGAARDARYLLHGASVVLEVSRYIPGGDPAMWLRGVRCREGADEVLLTEAAGWLWRGCTEALGLQVRGDARLLGCYRPGFVVRWFRAAGVSVVLQNDRGDTLVNRGGCV